MANSEVTPIAASFIASPANSPVPFEPSKPLLPRLLSTYQAFHKTAEAISHVSLDTIEKEHEHLKILSHQEMALLQKKAECALVEQSWSTLTTLANYSAVISQLGLAYLSAHQGSSASTYLPLIAAAGFNALHAYMDNLGGWNKLSESLLSNHPLAQERMNNLAPIAFFLANTLATALSLRSYETFTPSHGAAISLLQQIPAGLTKAASLKNHYLKTIKSQSELNINSHQSQIQYHQDHVNLFTSFLDLSIQQSRSIKKHLKKPILSLIQTTSIAAQKV
ncbi:MAG: hypothetical protein QRY72_05630 [Candidatus Rhabdochlamydia sp.]